MKMVTMTEAINRLKEADKGTGLTLYALRGMVKRGEIPSLHVGAKRLLDYDRLPEHLAQRMKMEDNRYA